MEKAFLLEKYAKVRNVVDKEMRAIAQLIDILKFCNSVGTPNSLLDCSQTKYIFCHKRICEEYLHLVNMQDSTIASLSSQKCAAVEILWNYGLAPELCSHSELYKTQLMKNILGLDEEINGIWRLYYSSPRAHFSVNVREKLMKLYAQEYSELTRLVNENMFIVDYISKQIKEIELKKERKNILNC